MGDLIMIIKNKKTLKKDDKIDSEVTARANDEKAWNN